MRLRQVALVARDFDRVSEDIAAVLGLGEPFSDPEVGRYGLRNHVWPIGTSFLELVSPVREGTSAGRLLDKRGADGGYMTIFQTTDIVGARAQVAAEGVRIVDALDRDGAHFTHLHPKDLAGAIASIDAMVPPERWDWGGPDWRAQVRTDVSVALCGAEIEVADAAAVSAKWARALALRRDASPRGWRLLLGGGELRFVDPAVGAGRGLHRLDVAVRDPAAVVAAAALRGCVDEEGSVLLCGTKLRLIPAAD